MARLAVVSRLLGTAVSHCPAGPGIRGRVALVPVMKLNVLRHVKVGRVTRVATWLLEVSWGRLRLV